MQLFEFLKIMSILLIALFMISVIPVPELSILFQSLITYHLYLFMSFVTYLLYFSTF